MNTGFVKDKQYRVILAPDPHFWHAFNEGGNRYVRRLGRRFV